MSGLVAMLGELGLVCICCLQYGPQVLLGELALVRCLPGSEYKMALVLEA